MMNDKRLMPALLLLALASLGLPASAEMSQRERVNLVEQGRLAKDFADEDWLQPPLVPERLNKRLAFLSAGLVVDGRCTKADFRAWGWGEAQLAGRRGQWFTYCKQDGTDVILYVKP